MPKSHTKEPSPTRLSFEKFYHNKISMLGAILFVLVLLLVIVGPFFSPYGLNDFNLADKEMAPSLTHWLGTDSQGRDVLSRVMLGGRISIMVGLLAAAVTVVIGSLVGGIAGFYGGKVDHILMRFAEMIYSLPFIPLVITLSAALTWKVSPQHKMFVVMLLIGILGWPSLARMVRGQILSLREQEFMMATKALGLSDTSKIFRHLLPNTFAFIVANATLTMASAILTEAGLSFLGLGVTPPVPTWGNLIESARDFHTFSQMPWMWLPAGIMIIITVVGINLLGEGLRDAFDPKELR